MLGDVKHAITDPEAHVAAIRQYKANRTEPIGKLIGQQQKGDGEESHIVVVGIDLFGCVRGKHVPLGDAVRGKQNDCKAMPTEQLLGQATFNEICSTVQKQHRAGVALRKHERQQTDRRYRFHYVRKDVRCFLYHFALLLRQRRIACNGLRKVEVAAIFDGTEDESGCQAAHIIDYIVRCLLAECQHRANGHDVLFTLR